MSGDRRDFFKLSASALTFCASVNQSYSVRLEPDMNNAWSIPMAPDGSLLNDERIRGLTDDLLFLEQ